MNKHLNVNTKRLVLREFCSDDIEAIHEYASDASVTEFMPWGPNSREQTAVYLQKTLDGYNEEPRVDYNFAVTVDGKTVIGGTSILICNSHDKQGYLGYLLNRNYWGNGFATEAVLAILNFAKTTLQLHRIWTDVDVRNVSSIHVLEKVGMHREGTIREHQQVRGGWRTSHMYSILDREIAKI